MEWRERALQLHNENVKPTPITEILRKEYPNESITFGMVRSHVRRNGKKSEQKPSIITVDNIFPTGVAGDIHIPYDHPNYPYFLQDTFNSYGVKQKVFSGDLFDHHATSRHQAEPQAMSPREERIVSRRRVRVYVDMFGEVVVTIGNHDERIYRQCASVGLDSDVIKDLHDIYDLPDSWEICDEKIIGGVLYKHGVNCLGKDGALNTAIQERMSTVIGHSHSFGGCKYSANKRDIIFGLNVGCGIDVSAYAFAYGKHSKYRPTLGCGIVFSPSCAIFVPMPEKYFRD